MTPFHARRQLCAFLFVIVSLLALASSAADAAVPPRPAQREYVVDAAGMVRPGDAERIRQIGTELREKTKAELVVVTVDSLDGTDIESYANELFRSWGIGDAKQSNGVLLLIAKEDRQFRIEVGYGLEGKITDGYAGSVLDAMKDEFRKENYSPAILGAYINLAQRACEEYGVGLQSLGAALGIPTKPANLGYVVDLAELLTSEDTAQIERMGGDLSDVTGVQSIIVTVPTLKKVQAKQYAEQLFADWQLKDAAGGKSILLFIAKEERDVLFVFGPAVSDVEKGDGGQYVINRITSSFPYDKEDLSEAIVKGYALLGEDLCKANNATVPKSIEEGGSEPVYVYILGGLVAILLIGLLIRVFYCGLGIVLLPWYAFAALVSLLTLGKINLPGYDHLKADTPAGGRYDDDDDDRYRGGFGGGSSSGGGDYGGGSSGGGGASGGW